MAHDVVLIPGDGIGPEITQAMRRVVEATGVQINWNVQEAGAGVMDEFGTPLPQHVLDAVAETKVAIKGPITTPVGTGFRSVNVALRKHFDLYACVRPCLSQPGDGSRFRDVDLVIVRENTEDQLDSTVASYSYNGKKSDITAREAIESQYSLDKVKNSDGNYTAPSADVILSYVRNKILLDAAEDEGITVSSKEMKKYAEDSIGTSDYKTMAKQYGVSKDQAKQIVRQSATLQKLYKKKAGDSASMPTAPTEPSDGNEDTASKDYADYIINLAGDEWDSEKGTWKDENSTYAKAFANDAFTADSATYKQAMTAYYTAYQQYSSQASSASSKWTGYANGLYAKANISIYGLFA